MKTAARHASEEHVLVYVVTGPRHDLSRAAAGQMLSVGVAFESLFRREVLDA